MPVKWRVFTVVIEIIVASTFVAMVLVFQMRNKNAPTITIADLTGIQWVTSPSCSPPCWEGIAPGQTSASDALALIKANKQIGNVQMVDDFGSERGEITWDWLDHSGGGRLFYNGTRLENGIVYAIKPSIGCCLPLAGVIENYGDPDYVSVGEIPLATTESGSPEYTFTLVWIRKGFRVSGFPQNSLRIDQDFQVNQIAFFVATLDGYRQMEVYTLLPWRGFDWIENYLVP